ncbi:enhancer of split m5 protein-like [Musca vetustissima]|uniref:enhancer of split m5 protein-like n=1 Tax=Musca vetustissima TaxID=27455 RepID=UPI002AB7E95E|nr:enhancer of split m5 protein-like [Musca vetustissima]
MAPQMEYVSKTQHYLKVKKPLLERQRRARINKCLDTLKELVAEFEGDDSIMRMDKAEMLESAVAFMKRQVKKPNVPTAFSNMVPMNSFRHGYMNAVNEVSRVMAATAGMDVHIGKAVMVHLGSEYNRLLQISSIGQQKEEDGEQSCSAPMSPASSGYHSDDETTSSAVQSPVATPVWRPW